MAERVKYKSTVIVTSDTCHRDPSKDASGQFVKQKLESLNYIAQATKIIVEDDRYLITSLVKSALSDSQNALIITIGGTGLCPRDVTPEATSILYEKQCSGIATALHVASLKQSPHAALSRLTAGIVGNCLIVNFPGSLKACNECFACLEGFLSHALEQVCFNADAIADTHSKMNKSKTVAVQGQTDQRLETNEGEAPIKNAALDFQSKCNLIDFSTSIDLETEQPSQKDPTPASPSKQIPSQLTKARSDSICTQTKPQEKHVKGKGLSSPYALIDYDQALEIMDQLSYELCPDEYYLAHVNTREAAERQLGSILADDLRSLVLVPPYQVSTMDGYVINMTSRLANLLKSLDSINAQLLDNIVQFEFVQDKSSALDHFICYQVNTGGRLPDKHFAVVPFERTGPVTTNRSQNELIVPIYELSKIKPGQFIRAAGSDLNLSDYLPAGTTVGPVQLSLIQSMGHKSFRCIKKPIVGVLSTGDELIESHNYTLNDSNKVVDVNGPLISTFLKSRHYPVVSCGICKDNLEDLLSTLTKSLIKCDVLVVTGGASMGTKDFIKEIIEELGGIIHYGRVKLKPGKPAGFASIKVKGKRKFIFTLPGNPVSSYVTTIVLVLPFLNHSIMNKFTGDAQISLDSVGDMISVEIGKLIDDDSTYQFDGRLEFLRARLDKSSSMKARMNPMVTVSTKQQSSRMLSFQDCDCLLIVEPHLKGIKLAKGQIYRAIRLKF